MRVGALVPARFGSCRVPQKNIKELNGKPLMFWTLDTLLAADCFDDITVSTESPLIEEMVHHRYASAVRLLRRPLDLAENSSPMRKVVGHYLQATPGIDYYGAFLPTYPFRKVATIQEINRQLQTGYLLRVVSMTSLMRSSRDLYYPHKNGVKPFFRPPVVYGHYMSSCYSYFHRDWIDPIWKRHGYTAHERTLRIHLSREENIDIDTMEDFTTARAVASGARFTIRNSVLHRTPEGCFLLPEGVPLDAFLDFLDQRLPTPTAPLLFLKESHQPGYTFTISDADPRAYFASQEAYEYYKPSVRLQETNCNLDQPMHYAHSAHYRALPASFSLEVDELSLPRPHPGGDNIPQRDECIPWQRVILMSELQQQPFYLEPVTLDFP